MATAAPKFKPRNRRAPRRVWVVLALAAVAGVTALLLWLPRPAPRPVPPPAHHTGTAPPQADLHRPGKVLWGSDFEDGDHGVFKGVRRDGSGLHAGHDVTTDVARTGTHSLKIVLPAPTSTPAINDPGRYQLVADMPDGRQGEDRWYGFSLYLGQDWNLSEIDNTRRAFLGLVGFRYTQTPRNGPGSNLGAYIRNGVPEFSTGTNLAGTVGAFDYGHHTLGPMVTGRWIDFVFHVRWSTRSDGLRQEWRDGVSMGRYQGPTLGFDSRFEYRIGPYEGVDVDHTRTLYVDNVRVGTSYAAVDPSR